MYVYGTESKAESCFFILIHMEGMWIDYSCFIIDIKYSREISGVKISGDRILVTSLAGSLNVLKRVSLGSFIVEK